MVSVTLSFISCMYLCVALIPHLEAVKFDLEAFISVLHSIGGGAFTMFYIVMCDGYVHILSVQFL